MGEVINYRTGERLSKVEIENLGVEQHKGYMPQYVFVTTHDLYISYGFEEFKFLGFIPVYKNRQNQYGGRWSWVPALFGNQTIDIEKEVKNETKN